MEIRRARQARPGAVVRASVVRGSGRESELLPYPFSLLPCGLQAEPLNGLA